MTGYANTKTKVRAWRILQNEQSLVLEGSVEDHDGLATAGDFVWRKPGSMHDNRSPGGAVLFAVYRKPNIYYDATKETAGFG
jgi:hypothetical protein